MRNVKFRPLPFMKGGPSLRTIIFVFVFVFVCYFTIQFLEVSEKRTRQNLLHFIFLGFFAGYYILHPILSAMELKKEVYVFLMLLVFSLMACVSFQNNAAFDMALKTSFAVFGGMLYIYLRNVVFPRERDGSSDK